MKQKRILLLGASIMQTPAVLKAKELGYYTITCDYKPENPGHKFADEYHNLSTTDFEAVLKLARDLKIDGVLSYMSDVSAPTAAYVAEKLGLPTSPYKSVDILTHKDKFRDFLSTHGFNCPRSRGYATYEEAVADIGTFTLPVMVKPTDSAGSKGVGKLEDPKHLRELVDTALKYSLSGRFVVEEFVSPCGYPVVGDGFSIDGKLVLSCFLDQRISTRSKNPFIPVCSSFPMDRDAEWNARLHNEFQRLISLLQMGTGAYNFEARIDDAGRIWIMELGPRCGGNFIPQIVEYTTGEKYVEAILRAAVGEACSFIGPGGKRSCGAYYVLHSDREGLFVRIEHAREIRENIRGEFLNVSIGERVLPFTGSNQTLGVTLMEFKSREEMRDKLSRIEDLIHVNIA